MASLKDIAAVKVAVEICNNPQLKKEILCLPDSDYDASKAGNAEERKEQWTEIVENKTIIIVENLGLSNHLQENVLGFVLSVGMRILTWAEYHEINLGFSRNYSFNFLNSSFFTVRGIIDCKKAAHVLMSDKSLSIKQKYKLALLYCMNEHISDLYNQLDDKDKEEFYDSENPSRLKQPHFVTFRSYYFKNEVDKLIGDKDPNLYLLQMAVKSGSKNAVEYCLEKTNLIRDEYALIDAALEAVENRVTKSEDWIVFDHGYSTTESWIPNDYYLDVLILILSKMTDKQRIEFLKQDIRDDYGDNPIDNPMNSKVLHCLLTWPYQDYFMRTARLMWEILPEVSYAELLLDICIKIELNKDDFTYGEEKCYDYRKLLMEFWNESPERNKRYFFRDNEIIPENGESWIFKSSKILLLELCNLKNFTYEDMRNIRMILACATNDEKDDIIYSDIGTNTCIELIIAKRWLILDEFISNCCLSKEKVKVFKGGFSCTEEAIHLCIGFIRNNDWKSFESFIRWSALPTEEIKQFKEKIISKNCATDICAKFAVYDKKLTAVGKVIF